MKKLHYRSKQHSLLSEKYYFTYITSLGYFSFLHYINETSTPSMAMFKLPGVTTTIVEDINIC